MPDNNETGSRKPRGTRKASRPAIADDWASVAKAAERVAATPSQAAKPERQRVAKAMARAGLCSRRDAEAWILDGRVSVNGEVLASPARDVGPDDRVAVDGVPLPAAEKTRLFLFHKPRGLVTSDHDPEGRDTIFDHLREHWPEGPRVVTVGRLDINTEGLLLLTNDGGLARMLELPKTGWLRRYRVRANGETDQAQLEALADGITIDGVDYAGIEAKLDRVQGANCWLTMGLREGKNREIKRVLEHLGLEVNRLIRLSFGPFQLLDLAEGAVEEVRTRVLKDQLGAALAAEAGVDFGDVPAPSEPSAATTVEPRAAGGAARPGQAARDNSASADAKPPRAARPAPATARRGDPRPAQSRANEGDGGKRPLRRREANTHVAPDHTQNRPRRHVSTLRMAEAEATRQGPRKRVERSDTRDRNDRTVAVERKVSTRPARSTSPSAEGKRARIARSGAPRRQEGRDDDRRGATSRNSAATRGSDGGERRQFRPRNGDDGRKREGRSERNGGARPERGSEARSPRRAGGGSTNEGQRARGTPRPARDADARSASTRPARGVGERPRTARPPRRDDGGKRRDAGADVRSAGAAKAGGDRPARFAKGAARGSDRGVDGRQGTKNKAPRGSGGPSGKGAPRSPRGGAPSRPKG